MFSNDWHAGHEPELIKHFQKGNKHAFGKLYDIYAPTLLGVIQRIVKDDKISDTLLQKSFMEIWNKRDNYESSKERFFNWMFKITRSIAISESQNKNRNAGVEIQNTQTLVNGSKLEDTITVKNKNINGIKAVIREDEQRSALDLVYYSGYTFAQAANQLKIPLDTLSLNVKMAIKTLKEATIK